MCQRGAYINNVKTDKIVGRFLGGLDIIYTDRQTDRQTCSLRHHKEGSAERLFPDRVGDGEGRSAALMKESNN